MSSEKGGTSGGRTFLRDVFPIPIVKLNLGGHRLADQLFRVFGPKRSITAKQYVGDDAKGAVSVGTRKERDGDVPG